MLNRKAMMAAPAAVPLYVEDVFSTHLYTGNGSTQTITNGIDLAGEGGLVWTKSRNLSGGHALMDTARGAGNQIGSNATDANKYSNDSITAFNNNGYSLGADSSYGNVNIASSYNYVSWTFRKAPKFFDVVTYTGDGTGSKSVSHSLGTTPRFMIIKRTNSTGNWFVSARVNDGANTELLLNSTAATYTGNTGIEQYASSTVLNVGDNHWAAASNGTNISGATYVAYLFAHDAGGFGDAGNQNVVSCGSFTTDGSAAATVNLGYEPQYVLIKGTSGGTWFIQDVMRGFSLTQATYLRAPSSSAEINSSGQYIFPTATGFSSLGSWFDPSTTYIYLAIRRGPMKTPTVGTSVYNASVPSSTSAGQVLTSGFTDDLIFQKYRTLTASFNVADRLRGIGVLSTANTNAENTGQDRYQFDVQDGVELVLGDGAYSMLYYHFRRAPGFFDVVCYTGILTAQTLNHNLKAIPELMIMKNRGSSGDWYVYAAPIGNTNMLLLNTTDASQPAYDAWDNTTPTATTFKVNGWGSLISGNVVAYLFATVPNVSKVGSYTGTGTTQQINCGFTTGARFVLIKRTDSTGSWYVWDSARGIVAGNDPYLLLNSTAAEVTNTDYVDALASGFEISSTAPAAINANGGNFVFLAIA